VLLLLLPPPPPPPPLLLLLLLLLLGAWQRSSISKLTITASHLGMLLLSTPVH
jgi:MYXO-CTERM domain-containing protein